MALALERFSTCVRRPLTCVLPSSAGRLLRGRRPCGLRRMLASPPAASPPAPAAPAGGAASPAGPPGASQASRYRHPPDVPDDDTTAFVTCVMVFMCVVYLWTGAYAAFLIAFPTLMLWMAVTR